MGRRSDHSREELEALIVGAGQRLMAEVGFARFSGREVAKRIGYSIGTIHNVFGSQDGLVLAINTATFGLWAAHLADRLAGCEAQDDRVAALVEGYFDFARGNRHLWMAIYDHRLPPGMAMPAADADARARLLAIVVAEVEHALGDHAEAAPPLARSLVATVHGHCALALIGSFAIMGETAPVAAALARVREGIAAARG